MRHVHNFFRRAAGQRAAAKELDHIIKWINLSSELTLSGELIYQVN